MFDPKKDPCPLRSDLGNCIPVSMICGRIDSTCCWVMKKTYEYCESKSTKKEVVDSR